MCGLVGYVDMGYSDKGALKEFLREGLYVDSLRGFGGTGMLVVDDKKEVTSYKRGLPGPDFLNSYAGALFDLQRDPVVVIGHNRAPTMGAINDKNAHPFLYKGTYGTIGLAHNGSLTNHHSLTPKGFFHEVDSAHACHVMAHKGPEEALSLFRGWFVFVFYDAVKHTFNIARNTNRDISFAYIKDRKGLVFASELPMLNWLAWRNDIDLEKESFSIGENSWVSWDLEKGGFKPKIRKIKVKEDVILHHHNRSNSYIHRETLKIPNPQKGTSTFPSYYYKEDSENVVIVLWKPYPQQSKDGTQYGIVVGTTFAHPYTPIEIHGVKQEEWDIIKDYAEVRTKLTGGRKIEGQWTLTCNLAAGAKESAYGAPKSSTVAAAIGRHFGPLAGEGGKSLDKQDTSSDDSGDSVFAAKELPEYTVGPQGQMMGMEAMKELIKDGCRRCNHPLDPEDGWIFRWTNEVPPKPLCQLCCSDPETEDYLEELKLDLIEEIDH